MYQTTDQSVWSGRLDAEDGDLGYRWHQIIKRINLEEEPLPPLAKDQQGFVILGFCCDEGIGRNKGRTGAVDGPAAVRKACAPLAWHYGIATVRLYDGGDIVCIEHNLEKAQDELRAFVAKIILKGYMPLILGGGHEVAYGSFRGIHHAYSNKNIGIINFDAHFDLRQYAYGGHSGSSFLQIADFCKRNNTNFNYTVLGIQKKSNTRILYQKARELSVTFFEAQSIWDSVDISVQENIKAFIDKCDSVYVTFCIDVFDQAYAPGVSAPCTAGLSPQIISHLMHIIVSSGKLVLFDMAEINPRYDRDGQTARLAAHLLFSLVDYAASQHSD